MQIRTFALSAMIVCLVPAATAAEPPIPVAALAATTPAPPGPVPGTRMTEGYVRLVARDAYFWAWPMANMMARRQAYAQVPGRFYLGGAPVAPLNELTMLTDYFPADVRAVACPNQDVVYGGGFLALDKSPVVIQVPDFGDRFWVYQVVDSRTDSFVRLGKMYGTQPGFYLLVGPEWQGTVPEGIIQVFRSPTSTGNVIPRVFMDDTAADRAAIQAPLKSVMMYPIDKFDGTMQSTDWEALRRIPSPFSGSSERAWVEPDKFFDLLPLALKDAAAQPGEEARYAQVLAVIEAAKKNPALRKAMDDEAKKADAELVAPLFEFRNYGLQLPNNWSTTSNTAAFGTDYFTRTAVAKSNIFVNSPGETKYFYQDLDADGQRLNGRSTYTVTFPKGATPPVRGFWSLTLYNDRHFFAPNELNRYSLGTKNKFLHYNPDGSLTLRISSAKPETAEDLANWLPAPADADFSLYLRAYWPQQAISGGPWTPPAVLKVR